MRVPREITATLPWLLLWMVGALLIVALATRFPVLIVFFGIGLGTTGVLLVLALQRAFIRQSRKPRA